MPCVILLGISEVWSRYDSRGMELLLEDLDWWIDKLTIWSIGGIAGCEYPIVTRTSLLNTPNAIEVLDSDASDDDGFGGVAGDIHDPNPKVFSQQWPTGVLPKSSFVGELAALRFHLS